MNIYEKIVLERLGNFDLKTKLATKKEFQYISVIYYQKYREYKLKKKKLWTY